MGYDMTSKIDKTDKGYFRLNIWGMGWMRGVMLEGDPSLEKELYRFCSNDGYVVGEKLGKKIAAALKQFLMDNPLGSAKPKKIQAEHEKNVEQMMGGLMAALGATNMETPGREEKAITQEDIDIISRFIDYNETQCPYEVW